MHSYTTDTEKTVIFSWIAIISVVASLALYSFFKYINIEVPWFIDAPSVAGFYGIFYKIFDEWFWKKITKIPDLTGSWKGKVITSYDKQKKEYPAELSIKQTWSHISLVLTTENSRSGSCLAMISTKNADGSKIHYAYENKPRHNAVSTMKQHDGTASLILMKNSDKTILEGDYYTGRDRKNIGTLYFEKEII